MERKRKKGEAWGRGGGGGDDKAPPDSAPMSSSYGSSLIWREQSPPCAELRTFLLTRSLETTLGWGPGRRETQTSDLQLYEDRHVLLPRVSIFLPCKMGTTLLLLTGLIVKVNDT